MIPGNPIVWMEFRLKMYSFRFPSVKRFNTRPGDPLHGLEGAPLRVWNEGPEIRCLDERRTLLVEQDQSNRYFLGLTGTLFSFTS